MSMEEVSDSGLEKLDILNLRTESETSFQQGHLRDNFFNVDCAKALDLSGATTDGPFFKPATIVDGGFNVSPKSGRPNGTSTVAPMDLEVKSDLVDSNTVAKIDYELLKQAVERVSMRMHNQGFLKLALAFAVTGRSAWFLLVRRTDPAGASPTLWLDRVSHNDVGSIWMRITHLAEQEPGFFLSDDGAALCTAISKIGVTPWCCRVKAFARSQSIVYGVTVPQEYTSLGKKLVGVEVTPSAITYAVKIIHDDDTFKTESAALRKIADAAGPNSGFYALGCVSRDGEATRFQSINKWETGLRYTQTGNFWWDRSYETVGNETGGAIIMRKGVETAKRRFGAKEALPQNVCSDIVDSLQLAHSVGVLHCDLRRSNFVCFDDGTWQLIDYSLSADVDSRVPYSMEAGAQADSAGNRVKGLYKEASPFCWTKDDDYQMLIANIIGFDRMYGIGLRPGYYIFDD